MYCLWTFKRAWICAIQICNLNRAVAKTHSFEKWIEIPKHTFWMPGQAPLTKRAELECKKHTKRGKMRANLVQKCTNPKKAQIGGSDDVGRMNSRMFRANVLKFKDAQTLLNRS